MTDRRWCGSARGILEWTVGGAVALILLEAFLIKGLAVPIRLASGSMAPNLAGPHRRIRCPECGIEFTIDSLPPPRQVRAVCPQCNNRSANVADTQPCPGARLLVDRVTPRILGWHRWQVVVFHCPERANHFCVKRLVGLPGERIQIIDGNIYINGTLERKPLSDQRRLAQQVDRTDVRPSNRSASIRWSAANPASGWQFHQGRMHYTNGSPAGSTDDRGGLDWLVYRHRRPEGVLDDVPYNAAESRPLHAVADLMLSCRVTTRGAGRLHVAGRDGHREFRVVLPAVGGTAVLRAEGATVQETAVDAPFGGLRAKRLEFSLFDAQVLVAIEGRTVICWTYPAKSELDAAIPNDAIPKDSSPPLAIACEGMDVELDELTVWRDVYYTQPRQARWACRRPYTIGPREVFVLGDNSPISDDGRTWRTSGGLPLNLVLGTSVESF
jgi:signal peptidase I